MTASFWQFIVPSHDRDHFDFWMLSAIGIPLITTFIPLTLLVGVHSPFSYALMCIQHKQQSRIHREGESKTVNESDSSLDTPYTHWTPPHSCSTTSNL